MQILLKLCNYGECNQNKWIKRPRNAIRKNVWHNLNVATDRFFSQRWFIQSYLFFVFFSLDRLFGPKRCSRCMASISSSELVMRARHLVFHVRCFSCTVCNSPLTKGDQFGMRDSSIFCRSHYEISLESPTTASTPLGMACQYTQYGSSPNGHTSPSSSENVAMKMGSTSSYFSPGTPHSMTGGLPQTPRQKGRPRKRKPKDIEAMTTNLGEYPFFLTLEITARKCYTPEMICLIVFLFWIDSRHTLNN